MRQWRLAPRGFGNGIRWRWREMRPRKFNGRGARPRDETATWRQSHGSGLHKCNVVIEVRERTVTHTDAGPPFVVLVGWGPVSVRVVSVENEAKGSSPFRETRSIERLPSLEMFK